MKATKSIYFTKGEGAVDHSTVTRWCKKFCLGYKSLDNQTKSDGSKNHGLQNSAPCHRGNSTQRISSELGISQSNVVCYLHDLGRSIWNCWIVLHVTKILQNF